MERSNNKTTPHKLKNIDTYSQNAHINDSKEVRQEDLRIYKNNIKIQQN